MLRPAWSIALICLLLLPAACGKQDVGEECDEIGDADECEDGAICTNEEGDQARCRKICSDSDECPAGHSCNGVSKTSIKSCQPDDKEG